MIDDRANQIARRIVDARRDGGAGRVSEVDYHGWSRHGRTIHVGPLPGRKSIALYRILGVDSQIDVLGYFRDASAARRFLGDLDKMLGLEP